MIIDTCSNVCRPFTFESRRNSSCVITTIFLLVHLVTAPTVSGDSAVPSEGFTWKDIVTRRSLEEDAINSIRFQYLYVLRDNDSKNSVIEISKTIEVGAVNQKFYQLESVTEGDVKAEIDLAFNGLFSRFRRSNDRDKFLIQSRDTQNRKHPTPWPAELLLNYANPEKISQDIESGKIENLVVKNDLYVGEDCTKASFDLRESGTITHTEVWYDNRKGFWPIRVDGRIDGQLVQQTFGEIGVFQGDGNKYFYPIVISRKYWSNESKDAIWFETATVDKNSVLINTHIVDSLFVLEPHPNEVLYDSDTHTVLHDPNSPLHVEHAMPSLADVGPNKSFASTQPHGTAAEPVVSRNSGRFIGWLFTSIFLALVVIAIFILVFAFRFRAKKSGQR